MAVPGMRPGWRSAARPRRRPVVTAASGCGVLSGVRLPGRPRGALPSLRRSSLTQICRARESVEEVLAQPVGGDTAIPEQAIGYTRALGEHGEDQMRVRRLAVLESLSFDVGQVHHDVRARRERMPHDLRIAGVAISAVRRRANSSVTPCLASTCAATPSSSPRTLSSRCSHPSSDGQVAAPGACDATPDA